MVGSVVLRSFLVVFSILVSSNVSDAKWKKVATFFAPNPFFYTYGTSAFFFDAKRGIIGSDGYAGMLRTSDGGKTWLQCTIPVNFTGAINDIFMYDQLNGWAVLEDGLLTQGLWKTSDGGATWTIAPSVVGPYTSVYQTPASVIYTSRYALSHLGFSTNGGQSFLPVVGDKFNGLNFVDNLHGVASVFSATGAGQAPGNAMWTNDGGLNWFTSNLTTEAWGVYAKKGTSTFVVVGEKISSDPLNFQTVEVSNDYGRTWSNKGVIQGRTTGHIAGVGDVLYVQSYSRNQALNQNTGMLRSTDGGKSWKAVGGPSNDRDTRFFVTGCLGGVVYAFDEDGGVWMTTDGGDGEIVETPHNPSLSPNQISLTANVCTSATGQAAIYNLSCNTLLINTIAFLDSSDEAISSGALSIT